MLTINLTTTSSRLELCSSTIWSLLNQSVQPDVINLWISHDRYMADEGISNIPEFVGLMNNISDIIRVHFVENTGPYRKLIPALRSSQAEDYIVYVDDDVVYGKDWLKTLLNCFLSHDKKYIVASRIRKVSYNVLGGKKSYSSYPVSHLEELHKRNFIVTGVGGCILQKRMIYEDLIHDDAFISLAPKTDDLWFSKIYQLSGIYVISCPNALKQVYEIQHSLSSLSLSNTLFFKNYGMFNHIYKIKNKIYSYFGLLKTNNDLSYERICDYFKNRR
ncbi:glycosyltransferase [Pluralibacter gergoviae]|uniref:glycosyltransferase n=1 Tax=Pluralibacter gergoviae TaxID=61647 RepID=UPI002EDB0619